jgi:post-segregation antitoxin (ccd killing protein)
LPQVYLKKELYDQLVKKGLDVSEFLNATVEAALRQTGRKTK